MLLFVTKEGVIMKYFKIQADFYKRPEIRWLMDQQGGSEYVVIYQMLCMEATKRDSALLINTVAGKQIPYTLEDLSFLTGYNTGTVLSSLQVLSKVKLIQILSDKSIFIPEVASNIGLAMEKNKGSNS